MEHDNSFLLEMRKKPSQRPKGPRPHKNQAVEVAEIGEAEVHALNELLAGQSHLWTFSGSSQSWLLKRIHQPSKNPRREIVIRDIETIGGGNGRPGNFKTKREMVVVLDSNEERRKHDVLEKR
jgi:hypothetical protein